MKSGRFECRPCAVCETALDLDLLGQTESLFALSNGHIGWRANLDEGEPHSIAGCYLNGVYEEVPLPYAETAYGYPEAGQTIVNVTDGKVIRLLVDDEPFDVRYGTLHAHERTLDFRTGVLTRTAEWESPTHSRVRVRSTRMVSLVHRALAAVLFEVEALDDEADLVLQSELIANEPVVGKGARDPRAGEIVEDALAAELDAVTDKGAVLVHSTKRSKLRLAASMDHLVRAPRGVAIRSESHPDHARFTVMAKVKPGQRVTLVKFVAYGWSSLRSIAADRARRRARELGLEGAAFPWRTIHGEECSGYWPASTAAFHVNADVADAVLRYVTATRDGRFEREYGAELLIETARLWASLGHFDRDGKFRIDGVTGPDEYSALADNNLYTNLMAQRNLVAAAAAARSNRAVAKRLKVPVAATERWRSAAENVYIPHDPDLKIHKQASQFTDHEAWEFAKTRPDQYPLFIHFPYFDLYRKQVVKQADLVLAMHLRGDAFNAEEKARNFAYYEAITVRDSSLSSCTQAIIAAEVGHLQLAHDYLGEAALMDIDDLEHNVRDGVHMGSLAGAWLAAVHGLGGMRHHGDSLGFSPRLPPRIRRLTFRVGFLGRLIKVSLNHERVTYTMMSGRALTFDHFGKPVRLTTRAPVIRPIPALRAGPAPKQPPGREPARRGRSPPSRLRPAK